MASKKITYSDSVMLQENIRRLNDAQNFVQFNDFLLEKWSDQTEQDSEKRRSYALKNFRRAIHGATVASPNTVKSWFAKKDCVKPSREMMFRIALALQLSLDETEEYFTRGALIPGIQINDYREFIFCYGLEHKLNYEKCVEMITFFEENVILDEGMIQRTHTDKLRIFYDESHEKTAEEFLQDMFRNVEMFKGYSKTVLNYFVKYKNEVLKGIREDAKSQLMLTLEETDFADWAKENGVLPEEYGVEIRRYINNEKRRKKSSMSKELMEEIRELHWIAYSSRDKNVDLLMELYASAVGTENVKTDGVIFRRHEEFAIPERIQFATSKHLSQILTVGIQKERYTLITHTLARMKKREPQESVPDSVLDVLDQCKCPRKPKNCQEAVKMLARLKKNQEYRCELVYRDDLLPLIHYVAQRRYQEQLLKEEGEYDCEEARGYFSAMANATLTACQMTEINPEYELDYLLLSAFCKNDMYSFSDVLESARLW